MADEEKNSTAVEEVKSQAVPQAFVEAEDKILSEKKAESQKDATNEIEEISEKEALSAEIPESLANIDPEVVEACRDYGWDDEKIAKTAEIMPEFFDEIRAVLDEENAPVQKEPEAPKPTVTQTEKQAEEIKFNLDPDMVGVDVKNAIDKIASVLNEQRMGLSNERGQLQKERDIAFNMRIDSFFDKSGLPDLGKTENLAKRQYMLRSELFAHANVTAQLRGIPLERALSITVDEYKNRVSPKEAEKRVLDKLEKQKHRFTNKPTRQVSESERKFTDEAERIEHVMEEAERSAGLI